MDIVFIHVTKEKVYMDDISKSYTEICEILKYMPKEYYEKIPEDIIKNFEEHKDANYEVKIDSKNPINQKGLLHNTMVILAILNYKFWCPNRKIKNDLYKIYLGNNSKTKGNKCEFSKEAYAKEKIKFQSQKSNEVNVFNNVQKNNYNNNKSTAMVEYKESIFKSFFYRIKKMLKGN